MLEMEILGVPKNTPLAWVSGYLRRDGYDFVRTTPLNETGVANLEIRYKLPGPGTEFDYFFIRGPSHNRELLREALERTSYRLVGPVLQEVRIESVD